MPVIKFAKGNRSSIEVPHGANLMKALLDAGLPVASSCHGDGICGKCRLIITDGMVNLSKPNEDEIFLIDRFELKKNMRISCQTEVLGDVTVDATYW